MQIEIRNRLFFVLFCLLHLLQLVLQLLKIRAFIDIRVCLLIGSKKHSKMHILKEWIILHVALMRTDASSVYGPCHTPLIVKRFIPYGSPFIIKHNSYQKEILLIYINKESSFLPDNSISLTSGIQEVSPFRRVLTRFDSSRSFRYPLPLFLIVPHFWPAEITTNCNSVQNSGKARSAHTMLVLRLQSAAVVTDEAENQIELLVRRKAAFAAESVSSNLVV